MVFIIVPYNTFLQIMRRIGLQLKETGNEHFNEGKYPLALHSYQQSIQIFCDIIYYFPEVLREVVLLYGNHSLTLLKLDRLEDALQSANKCIQFDESFPKVRRFGGVVEE